MTTENTIEDYNKSGTIIKESKVLLYYEIIDKLNELIQKNPDDHFMNEKRKETIDRFEKKIQKILHKKTFFRRVKDAFKELF
jgi:hypothetical protein